MPSSFPSNAANAPSMSLDALPLAPLAPLVSALAPLALPRAFVGLVGEALRSRAVGKRLVIRCRVVSVVVGELRHAEGGTRSCYSDHDRSRYPTNADICSHHIVSYKYLLWIAPPPVY